MIFSEQQLERFSKPPFKYELKQVVDTHKEIRTAIDKFYEKEKIKEKYELYELPDIDPFLQGSYSNDTNITQSSDVDIVIRLKNVWRAHTASLSQDDAARYKESRKDSSYSFSSFNSDILASLREHFGKNNVINDNKCLRLRGHSKYCDADIIPAFTYKHYGVFPSAQGQKFDEGICFDTNEGLQIVNFPKQHQQALTDKSRNTDGNFKETVRMFKNLKEQLVERGRLGEKIAKSYFIENLLFNVKDATFYGTYKERFTNILNELISDFNSEKIANYKCANGLHKLISEHTWDNESLKNFLVGLIFIREKNEF